MPVYALDERLLFPHPSFAEPDGLLAMGGDLSPERLLLAYRHGIFPWFDGDMPLWWSPDPRFVLFPDELRESKSMLQVRKKSLFTFTRNKAFPDVIRHCKSIPRDEQDGTWITPGMEAAYTRLHTMGHAQSAEAWQDGRLVGGLYGLRIGTVFCGESMFSLVSNASKFAFIQLVRELQAEGVILIDCQVHTAHLESLGAVMIPRQTFLQILEQGLSGQNG